MGHAVFGMTLMIKRGVGRRVWRLPGLLGALDVALVDRGVKHALALLLAVLLVHRGADLFALGGEWHRGFAFQCIAGA